MNIAKRRVSSQMRNYGTKQYQPEARVNSLLLLSKLKSIGFPRTAFGIGRNIFPMSDSNSLLDLFSTRWFRVTHVGIQSRYVYGDLMVSARCPET